VTEQAQTLNNRSATIEVGGDVTQWAVAQTKNENTKFSTTIIDTVESRKQHIVNGVSYSGEQVMVGLIDWDNNDEGVESPRSGLERYEVFTGTDNANISQWFGVEAQAYIVVPSKKYPFSQFPVIAQYSDPDALNPDGPYKVTKSKFVNYSGLAIKDPSTVSEYAVIYDFPDPTLASTLNPNFNPNEITLIDAEIDNRSSDYWRRRNQISPAYVPHVDNG
ncbi:hypothetical protein, partial [Formosimonas limnophila]|uniref:hypothetical protein n=1 Tax=Formosimonas limnophila TaxID=1384487 RepID=UPI00167A964E